jgi:two-component system sensor histidine kinase KdpD
MKLKPRQKSVRQFITSMIVISSVSVLCFIFSSHLDYRITAMFLLVSVSLIAVTMDIVPVIMAALLSAIILNFFFIQPVFTFHISDTEDILMFFIYIIIALVSALLTYRIRLAEHQIRDREEKAKTIRLYDTFLNSLSHELRTPIATIIGAVDVLKSDSQGITKDDREEVIEQIDIASTRLNYQVGNMLSMSRLESGMLKPKTEWLDLSDLFQYIVNKLPFGHEKIVIKEAETLPLVKTDSLILEQVISNLLVNALQYGGADNQVELSANSDDKNLCIFVSDQGPGIAEEQLKNVFRKFFRVSDSHPGGSGLGLAIVKGYVDALNGQVVIRNRHEGGLEIQIDIPVEISYLKNLKNE